MKERVSKRQPCSPNLFRSIYVGLLVITATTTTLADSPSSFSLLEQERDFATSYNQGVVAFRTGQFELAEQHFQIARASSSNELAAKAHYNLGNARFEQAFNTESSATTDPQTVSSSRSPFSSPPASDHQSPQSFDHQGLQAAIKAYRDCLAIDRNFHDARYNLEAALRLMEQQQPPSQDPKNQDPNQNKDNHSQENQDANQDQGSKDQGSKDPQQSDDQQSPAPDTPQDQGSSSPAEPQSPEESQTSKQRDQPADEQDAGEQEQSGSNESQKFPDDSPASDSQSKPDDTAGGTNNEATDDPSISPPTQSSTPADENRSAGAPEAALEEPGTMTPQEAEKLLQAIRDRDLLRRLRLDAAKRQRRVRVPRDW